MISTRLSSQTTHLESELSAARANLTREIRGEHASGWRRRRISPTVVPLLRNYPTAQFSIAAVYRRRQHLAGKVRVFIDALARAFAGRDWLNPEGAAPPR
jgi:hypothetical protein